MNYNLNEETKALEYLFDMAEDVDRLKDILLKIKSKYGRGWGSEKSSLMIRRFLEIHENIDVEITVNQKEVSIDYIVYNWEREESMHHKIYSSLDRKDPKELYMEDPYSGIVASRLLNLLNIIEQQELFYCK